MPVMRHHWSSHPRSLPRRETPGSSSRPFSLLPFSLSPSSMAPMPVPGSSLFEEVVVRVCCYSLSLHKVAPAQKKRTSWRHSCVARRCHSCEAAFDTRPGSSSREWRTRSRRHDQDQRWCIQETRHKTSCASTSRLNTYGHIVVSFNMAC